MNVHEECVILAVEFNRFTAGRVDHSPVPENRSEVAADLVEPVELHVSSAGGVSALARIRTPARAAIHVTLGQTMSKTSVLSFDQTEGERFRPGFERRILYTSQLMTVVLDIDNGPWAEPDPYHSHPHEQTTYIADGELLFLAEGDEPRRVRAGDLVAVPSGVPHSIQLLSARARLVDTFNPIREDFLKREG
jgi:quercetin dioxygenase-like cupin family protein